MDDESDALPSAETDDSKKKPRGDKREERAEIDGSAAPQIKGVTTRPGYAVVASNDDAESSEGDKA